MNLHYSQTALQGADNATLFFYHMNLHYSQTVKDTSKQIGQFFYHMNLHYSQTSIFKSCHYEARYISIWLSI